MRLRLLFVCTMVAGLLGTTSCRKNSPLPAPDPCLGARANPLTFRFLESYGTPTPDTALSNQTIAFDGPGTPYTSYEWRVGTDPRPFTQRRFGLYFPRTRIGTFLVRLIAHRPPNLRCFPKDDGVDTLTQTLTVVDRNAFQSPVYGKFLGANVDAPRDTFTIRVFSGPSYQVPVDPLAAPYDYLRNLGRGCQSPYFNIGMTWRGLSFFFNGTDFNCLSESGSGYLPTRDSIRIDYSQRESSNSSNRVNRVFRGRRVR